MRQSENKSLGKKKHYNIQRGKKDNHFFFVFPGIVISPKKFLHWDIMMFSIFLGWGRYFIQFNIFETVKDTSTAIMKPDMINLLGFLRSKGLTFLTDPKNTNMVLEYLNKNPYLITLIKNSNLHHPYISHVILSHFEHQPFILDYQKQ